MGISLKGIFAVITTSIVISGVLLFYVVPIFLPQPESQIGGEEEQYALTLPIRIYLSDRISGGAIQTGTIYVFDSSWTVIETTAVDSNTGYADTSAFRSGTKIIFFPNVDGYMCGPVEYTVPYADSPSQERYYARLQLVKRPADANLSLSLMDDIGNQVATETSQSGATMESDGTLDLYFHIVIAEGFGLISYDDPVEEEMDAVLVVFDLNTTLATISGLSNAKVREHNGHTYYFATLQDLLASKNDPITHDIFFTVNYGGSNAISLTAYIITNVDPDLFYSSLNLSNPDTDALVDYTQALVISPAS